MREHGKRAAAWFLTVVMVITMIVPYGGAGIPFAGRVKAADLIDLSGKDGAHKVTVVATTETGLGNYYTGGDRSTGYGKGRWGGSTVRLL